MLCPMRWTRDYESDQVDDRRGERPASAGLGGSPIALLFWLYIISLSVLCGAEFNAQLEMEVTKELDKERTLQREPGSEAVPVAQGTASL